MCMTVQVMEERAKKYPLPPILQEQAGNTQVITATGEQSREAPLTFVQRGLQSLRTD